MALGCIVWVYRLESRDTKASMGLGWPKSMKTESIGYRLEYGIMGFHLESWAVDTSRENMELELGEPA